MTAHSQAIEFYLAGKTVEEACAQCVPPISVNTFYSAIKRAGVELRGPVSRRSVLPDDAFIVCSTCGLSKCVTEFSKSPNTRSGYDSSRCKVCKKTATKAALDWATVPIETRIYNRVKGRACRKGILFDLEPEDIVLPDHCPVFGKPFIYGDHRWTYSVDRKDPKKGYTKDNIAIISNHANMMKSTATTEEVGLLFKWMQENCP